MTPAPTRPRVSVIIPTYNRAAVIGRAIGSVLAQTYGDFEIIVVDDGSTDDTAAVVRGLALPPDRLRYLSQPNRGRSAARNTGLAEARGEYIAFLDSDDVFLPDKLDAQVTVLDAQPECGLVYGYYLSADEQGRLLHAGAYPAGKLTGWIYPDLLFIAGTVITTPSVMVRAGVLKTVGGFDETLHMCEDLDLWRRIARQYPVCRVPRPLVQVTYRDEPLQLDEKMQGRTAYYRKAIGDDPSLSRNVQAALWTEMYWHYGAVAVLHGDTRRGWAWLARAGRESPAGFARLAARFALNRLMAPMQAGVRLAVRVLKPRLPPAAYQRLRSLFHWLARSPRNTADDHGQARKDVGR